MMWILCGFSCRFFWLFFCFVRRLPCFLCFRGWACQNLRYTPVAHFTVISSSIKRLVISTLFARLLKLQLGIVSSLVFQCFDWMTNCSLCSTFSDCNLQLQCLSHTSSRLLRAISLTTSLAFPTQAVSHTATTHQPHSAFSVSHRASPLQPQFSFRSRRSRSSYILLLYKFAVV